MPRPRSPNRRTLTERAMIQFWQHGFAATSIADLVHVTGTNRAAIYGEAGGKAQLFDATLALYRDSIVTPAFARVEAPGATLDDLAAYIEKQIALAETKGLPGPGCLVGNTMTEGAPTKIAAAAIAAHLTRLQSGIKTILTPHPNAEALAHFAVTALQGLWAMSRQTSDATPLRTTAAILVETLRNETAP